MHKHRLRAALVTMLCLWSCGSDDRPAALGTHRGISTESDFNARGRWCDSLCANARRCQFSVSAGCTDGCWQTNVEFFGRTSSASLNHQSSCMDAAACPANFDDILSGCWQDSLELLEPSDQAQAQCEALAPEFFECDWFASRDSCARFHANFSGRALTNERQCAGSSCEELDACVSKQLYGAN